MAASCVLDQLIQSPRYSPREAANTPIAQHARKALKEQPDLQLRKELTAFRVGLTAAKLDANPGLQEFLENPSVRVDSALAFYGHTLEVRVGEVFIRHQGQMRKWSEVRGVLPENLSTDKGTPVEGFPDIFNPPRWYDETGVVNSNYFASQEVKPIRKEQATGKWYAELCCYCDNTFSLRGHHSYARLIDAEGNVYVVALYRRSGATMVGFSEMDVQHPNPDAQEFYATKPTVTRFEVTEEGFKKALERFKRDIKNPTWRFQVLQNNCTSYALDILKDAGVELYAEMSFLANFIPRDFYWQWRDIRHEMSPTLKAVVGVIVEIVHYPFALLANIVFYILGGHDGYYEHIWEIFDPRKVMCLNPNLFAYYVKPRIDEERGGEFTLQRSVAELP